MYGVARPVNAHNSPNCSSPALFARRDLHARHLGTRHNLGSRRESAGHRPELPRAAVPRQGRLLCHAAKQVSMHAIVLTGADVTEQCTQQ